MILKLWNFNCTSSFTKIISCIDELASIMENRIFFVHCNKWFLVHIINALFLLMTLSHQFFFVSIYFSLYILLCLLYSSYSNCLFPFWKRYYFSLTFVFIVFIFSSIASFQLLFWIIFSKHIGSQFAKRQKRIRLLWFFVTSNLL